MPPEPGWPQAAQPRSICIIGWARLSAQQREGSGYNLSASELACGLAYSGHRVCYLRSGIDYTILGGTRIEPTEQWRGIDCYNLINSPNLAISRFNFRNQRQEMSSPAQTRMVLEFLRSRSVELVHVHSLEGFGLDLLPAIKAAGMKLVVTLHNHWYACPQVDLLHRESGVCMDFKGGVNCVECLATLPPQAEIRRRRFQNLVWKTIGPNAAKFAREARDTLKSFAHATVGHRAPVVHAQDRSPADMAMDPITAPPLVAPGKMQLPHGLPVIAQPIDANEQFCAARHHRNSANEYGQRRLVGLESLKAADRVIGPSHLITDVLVAMDFPAAKCQFIPYGQPHFDALRRIARGDPFYRDSPWEPRAGRPLRVGFLGTVFPNKGLEVLVRAIPLMETADRQRCQFVIRAYGDDAPFRRRLAMYPEVTFLGGYAYEDLAKIHRDLDIAIVPHIWLENAPLAMLEMINSGKFLIVSRLGGVVDFIREPAPGSPGNGLFTAGGDPESLVDAITRCVRGEVRIPSPAEVHSVAPNLISFLEHVTRVQALYDAV